jgi:hypothetical protein
MIQVCEIEFARLVREAAALKCVLRVVAEYDDQAAVPSKNSLHEVRRVLDRQRGRIRQLETELHAFKTAIAFQALGQSRAAPVQQAT